MLVVFSSGIYYFERGTWDEAEGKYYRDDPITGVRESDQSPFQSIPQSLWWCIVTLTTVGYGDMFPYTDLGKVLLPRPPADLYHPRCPCWLQPVCSHAVCCSSVHSCCVLQQCALMLCAAAVCSYAVCSYAVCCSSVLLRCVLQQCPLTLCVAGVCCDHHAGRVGDACTASFYNRNKLYRGASDHERRE